jgi:hypothetical protein
VSERRKTLRRSLHLPVVVKGHGKGGAWEETTTTTDVCHGGVALTLVHPAATGQVLQLSLALPEMFRRYDLKSPTYRVFALVRYCYSPGPPYRVGLMFFGRRAPRGYEQNPAGLFFLPTDPHPGGGDRVQPRHPLLLTVRLRRLDEAREGPPEELTITEDVSLSGAGVRTTLPVSRGEMVSVAEADGPFRASAMVLAVTEGADKVTRLNLQFLNEADAAEAVKDLLRRQGIAGA